MMKGNKFSLRSVEFSTQNAGHFGRNET